MSVYKESSDNSSIEESDSEYDEIDDYYNNNDDDLLDSDGEGDRGKNNAQRGQGDGHVNNNMKKLVQDLEYFQYECLSLEKVDEKLESESANIATILKISVSSAALVLQANKWKSSFIINKAVLPNEKTRLLVQSGVLCSPGSKASPGSSPDFTKLILECGVCMELYTRQELAWLSCSHLFCRGCWTRHIDVCIANGLPSVITCMAKGCELVCTRDFIEQFLISNPDLFAQFTRLYRNSCIVSHNQLRFCPGADCPAVIYAPLSKARRVECNQCDKVFCFECGNDYHCPTNCATIKRWLTKCGDDSETAHYICANTKNCPQCHICIEKNGGCNHIQCSKCRFDFCWMCLADWKSHGNSYYVCSRYKENPLIAEQNQQAQAREALKKYLFYFERWENHNQSLLLEAEARKKIQSQIEAKVMKNEGTWIDWQHLLRGGELLAKCRCTLQNTYPLAYYSPPGAQKELFEYQQAQLEVEIEGLAWKLENASLYQRGEIENQMDIAEKRRYTLLLHFLKD